jgi:hypothetical protein
MAARKARVCSAVADLYHILQEIRGEISEIREALQEYVAHAEAINASVAHIAQHLMQTTDYETAPGAKPERIH